MKECLCLYHTSFTQYWKLYWLNQNFTSDIDSEFTCYEIVDNIPFLPSSDVESKPIRYRILYTLLKSFFTLKQHAERLSIMPKNEELDDISTLRLAFIAIPYFLGFFLLELPALDNRLILLNESSLYFNEFVTRLSNISPKFRIEVPETRTDKVALAKRDMEIKKKINYLLSLKPNINKFDPNLEDVISPLFPNYGDESTIRELTILLLSKFALESQRHIQSIERELEILKFKSSKSNSETNRNVNYEDKPCSSDLRTRIQKNVFIPGHSLPTITLAECARLEMEMELNIGSKSNGKKVANSSDSDSDDTIKAREWDNWKDEHPWGSGNKNRNIS